MTSLRLALLATVILAGFVPVTVAVAQAPVEWYRDTGGGGVLAQPTRPLGHDGGAPAPHTASGETDVPESDISATPPIASPAQAEPVLGAPADKPAPKADQPSSPQAAQAAQAAPTVTGGENQDTSSASGLIAALPLTGLQLAAVAGAGLCLLVAGALVRPRRRPAS
jgi:hypothetical protein